MLRFGTADGRRAANHVGRIGALAVALGIGAALTTPPVAVAEPGDTGTTSSSTESESGAAEDDSALDAIGDLATDVEAVTTATLADVPAATDDADPESTPVTTAVPDGTVTASGGANTTVRTSDGITTSADPPTAGPTTTADSDRAATTAAEDEPESLIRPTAALSAETVSGETVSSLSARSAIDSAPEPAPPAAVAAPQVIDSIALVSPSKAQSAAPAAPVDPVVTFVTRVVSLAAGLFSLMSPSTPTAPAPTPFPWVLVAWVRRQLEETLFDDSPRIGFGAVTTSQSAAGVVTGAVSGASGANALSVRVAQGPSNGTVAVNQATGEFTYVPTAAMARSGGLDRFTVVVTDERERPPNVVLDIIGAVLGLRRNASTVATVLVPVLAIDTAHDDAQLDAADLVRLAADGKVRVHANDEGAVRSIDGTFTDAVVRNETDAAAVMNRVAQLLRAAPEFAGDADITSRSLRLDATGESGEVIYRLRPTVNGIPTMSSQVVLTTDARGAVTGVFSSYDSRINDVDTTWSAGADEESAALAAVRAALLTSLAEDLDAAATAAVLAALTTESELVVYDVDPDVAPMLARRITVYTAVLPVEPDADPTEPLFAVPVVSRTYYVHANGAQAGGVFAEISDLHEASWWSWSASTRTLTDLSGQKRTVNGQYLAIWGAWRFNDTARGLRTYSASSSAWTPGTLVTKSWWTRWNRSAVSAQANTALVYDYYRDTLTHTSYDGLGSIVRVSVLPKSYNNAYWDPNSRILAFGNDFEAALDVVGHEFTHGVIDYAVANGGGLIYQNESGALNEAYADILGALIENKTGPARWLIAEDQRCGRTTGCAIRDMSDPSRFGQPEHYANLYTGTADYGGVHTNSGIFSFAAYKMMTDTRTAAVSDAAWAQVFYGSLYRLPTNATFEDGRAALLSTAASQGFTTAQRQAMADAFDAVGIADF